MEIRYQLFEKDYLLIQKFIDLFSIEDYLSYNNQVRKELSFRPIKKVLLDFRNLVFFNESDNKVPRDFREKIEKMVEIRKNINQIEHKDESVKLVIWVEKSFTNCFCTSIYQ